MGMKSCPWLLAFKLTIFVVHLRGKACYKRGHSAQYSGFQLATSTFVLSILDIDFYSHKHCAFTT